LDYRRGEVIDIGFSERPVSLPDLEGGGVENTRPSAASEAIVFYARFINLEEGDRLRLVLYAPNGELARNTIEPLERHKAQYVAFVGRRSRAERWPGGRYRGRVQLLRLDAAVLDQEVELLIP